MNQLRLDKRDVTLNEKDSCLDMLVFTKALWAAYEQAEKEAVGKELIAWIEETKNALQAECDEWEKSLQKPPRV